MREEVVEWLLDSDPAMRWQVMEDLTNASPVEVAAERARVAVEGWGAGILSQQGPDGNWGTKDRETLIDLERLPDAADRRHLRELHRIDTTEMTQFLGVDADTVARWETDPLDIDDDETAQRYLRFLTWMQKSLGTYSPKWISTTYTLLMLVHLGIEPESPGAQRAVGLVADNVKWHLGEVERSFFDGETEQCINGMVVATGSYFNQEVDKVVDRLLSERLDDGGWNCEAERGSVRSSFDSTLSVLEGLLAFEQRVGGSAEVAAARRGAEEYLLERRLFRRLSDGEVVDPKYTTFSFPPRWHYDVLRALDYLRAAGNEGDERCAEAVDLVLTKQDASGRWVLEDSYPGLVFFDVDDGDGQPSRWNTLRALRVIDWYH